MDMVLNPPILQKWRLFLTRCTNSTLSGLALLHDKFVKEGILHRCDFTAIISFSHFHITIQVLSCHCLDRHS